MTTNTYQYWAMDNTKGGPIRWAIGVNGPRFIVQADTVGEIEMLVRILNASDDEDLAPTAWPIFSVAERVHWIDNDGRTLPCGYKADVGEKVSSSTEAVDVTCGGCLEICGRLH